MPKMSDHDEYLNSAMVANGDIVVMLNEGEFIEPSEGSAITRTIFQINVKIPDGRLKIWTMNKTTRKNLAKVYGDDSANWVNKKVELKVTTQSVRGELRDILWGHPVEGDPAPAPTQAKITANEKGDAIIDQILKAKPDMTRSKVVELIATEMENSGGVFGKHVGAVLVARSLGINLEETGEKIG